jgi:hypothetical protein
MYIYYYFNRAEECTRFPWNIIDVSYLDAVLYCDCETVQLNRLIMNSKIVIVISACVWHVAIL